MQLTDRGEKVAVQAIACSTTEHTAQEDVVIGHDTGNPIECLTKRNGLRVYAVLSLHRKRSLDLRQAQEDFFARGDTEHRALSRLIQSARVI